MPTYDYRCKGCGHELEMFQSMSAGPKRKCPECGKNQLERLIGMGGALLFKGKGFWQTDYRSKSYTEGEKLEQEATKDSKPEAGKDKAKDAKQTAKSKTEAETGTGAKTEAKAKPKADGKSKGKPKH